MFYISFFPSSNLSFLTNRSRVGLEKALGYEARFQSCVLRMIEDEDEQSAIMSQLTLYKDRRGYFGSKFATKGISEIDPSKFLHISDLLNSIFAFLLVNSNCTVAWWGLYGIGTPALMIAARRILGLCCTASSCERNWSTFDFVSIVYSNPFIKYHSNLYYFSFFD